jgi:hypothetical protein
MKKFLGVTMIVLALTLAIAPAFTDCQSTGKTVTTVAGTSIPMKCHWAGIAEIGAAVPLAVAGIYALRSRRKDTTRFAGILGATSSAVAILLPTVLIGTCASPTMSCNLLMRPILLSAGILAAVASVALFVSARDHQPAAVSSGAPLAA